MHLILKNGSKEVILCGIEQVYLTHEDNFWLTKILKFQNPKLF